MQFLTCTGKVKLYHHSFLHCALSLAAQRIVIGFGPVCLFVCLFVCYSDNWKLHTSIFTKVGLQVKVLTISSWWLWHEILKAVLLWTTAITIATHYLLIHRWHWHRLLAFIISQCISGNGKVFMKVLEVGKMHTIKILRRCPLLHNGA